MALKEKFIGLILIVLGVLPFLLKIEKINSVFSKISFLIPGEIVYQIIIIILGILLIWKLKTRPEIR